MLIFYFLYGLSFVEEYTQKDFYLSVCECGLALIIVTVKSYRLEMETVGRGPPARKQEKARPEKKGEWEYGDKPERGLVVEWGVWSRWAEVTDHNLWERESRLESGKSVLPSRLFSFPFTSPFAHR